MELKLLRIEDHIPQGLFLVFEKKTKQPLTDQVRQVPVHI